MTMLTQERLQHELAQLQSFLADKRAAELAPIREEQQRLDAAVRRILADSAQARVIKAAAGDRPRVQTGPYQGLGIRELKVAKAILETQIGSAEWAPPNDARAKMLTLWHKNLTAAMDSVTAAAGDELVPTAERSTFWDDVNLVGVVAPLFEQVDMPTNPYDVPLQLGEMNWYAAASNIATTGTDLATKKQTLTAYELAGGIPFAYDLEENAVIGLLAQFNRSILRDHARVVDDVLLNGDTTETNGINSDGATIAKTTAGKSQWLIGFDGLVHMALIDGPAANRNDASNAAIADSHFTALVADIGKYGIRPQDCAFLMDTTAYANALAAANFRTIDKFGPHATLLNGQLAAVGNIPVIVSEEMALADADGKVTDAGNVTDRSRILLVNRTQWMVGWKRRLLIEPAKDAWKRQNALVASAVLAFAERSTARSTAEHTAITYNLAI